MEKAEVESRVAFLRRLIEEPVQRLTDFLSTIYPLVGASSPIALPGAVLIQTQAKVLSTSLDEKVKLWHRRHIVKGSVPQAGVKLDREQLRDCLQKGTVLVRAFYEQRILSHLSASEVLSFWAGHRLNDDDWPGLCRVLLKQAVNADVLTPVEESDERFSLTIETLDARAYVDMLLSSTPRDHLE